MKLSINLGEILTKAWKITWKFKILWIFGILAGCGASNRSNFNFNTGGNSGGGGSGGNNNVPEFFRQFQNLRPEQAAQSFLDQYGGFVAAAILVLCCLWIVFYFLGIMGRTGLIKGIVEADAGAERLTFGEIWTESLPYFWRMFGLALLVGLPVFLLLVILLVGAGFAGYSAYTGNMAENGILILLAGIFGVFVLAGCILSLIMAVVGMIVEQVRNAIVLEDLGLLAAFSRGWEVFRANWFSVLVMALILWVLGIVVGLIVAIPIIIAVVPVAIGIGLTASTGNYLVPILIGIGCLIVLLPVSLLLNGIQETYFQSVWTLTYRSLTTPALPPAPQVEIIQPCSKAS
jgi:hypothetical protein